MSNQHCAKGLDCGILGNHTHPDVVGVQRGIAVGEANVTPNPVPSEVAETTAGEREADFLGGLLADQQKTWDERHGPAEPDTGEVEALVLTIAQALNRHALARPYGETTAWCLCLTWSIDRTEDRAADERAYEVHVATHVASDWLAAHDDRVRRVERERIAQAIEADRSGSLAWSKEYALRIARAASVGRGEGL